MTKNIDFGNASVLDDGRNILQGKNFPFKESTPIMDIINSRNKIEWSVEYKFKESKSIKDISDYFDETIRRARADVAFP